ncbi:MULTISPECIES: ABC transporter ATP-binding protein [Microcella]|uniref:ABC transporter ATP-binding protein n=1 Tax=Microcella TaxID=337004 RepID=UPI0015CF7F6B|nr:MULTISPECIES: ABC transporter ATP-binding protein [Microcella]QOD93095.1 ABC transporter ATP-binding protein [Chryseoglobus sp. 28M-23]
MTGVFGVDSLGLRFGAAQILDDVTWSVERGETLGVVGESGSGKSMTVLAATGLLPASAAMRLSGRSWLGGDAPFDNLLALSAERLRRLRGPRIGYVFQDPATSLNPLLTVERQITEGLEEHLGMTRRAAARRAVELLELVGVPDPGRRVRSYPHQLSGGMRQRVMIAIALSCEPEVLIADEPTTALDVTIQAQIIDVVADMQERSGTAVVWISHDLGVVGGIADRIVVLYGGQVVETGTVRDIFADHRHPYTAGLLASRPRIGDRGEELAMIPGSPPDPRHLPPGCVFYDRCTVRADVRCATERPPLAAVSGAAEGHLARSFCAQAPAGAVRAS